MMTSEDTDDSFDMKSSFEKNDLEDATLQIQSVDISDFDDPNLDKNNIVEDDSPYAEVRSAVANTDDLDMPVNTLRAWVLGLSLAILISGLNQFFFFRYPSVSISNLVAQLLAFPVGTLWAKVVPRWSIFGLKLNPGPFTIKEHVLITIMATVGAYSAYACDLIAAQRLFYNQTYSFGYQWMIVMSTQLIGFSIGGIARRFLVQPPSMIWPQNLVYAALFNTLHQNKLKGEGDRGGISRGRFFIYVFTAGFFWYFLPGYAFQALSYFSWVCWIAPNNIKVNQLFGYASGLGMSVITFDWAQIAYIISPLVSPWWATANIFGGFVFFFWFLTPILYYTNAWYSQYMPISSRTSFDRFGNEYNVSAILTPEGTMDMEAYKLYSPLYLSTTFALSYGVSFAAITSILMHTILYFRKQIWKQARRSMKEQPDIHARLMSNYSQVPEWWYAILFVVMFVFGIVSIEVLHTEMPVWGFILSLAIAFIFVLPIGMIQAITNQQLGLNVITEFVAGYILPGRPIAMMMFKTYGYVTMGQALTFTSDFKLGHYMKIPPRDMFWAQILAGAITGTVQLAVQAWMFTNIPNMCSSDQESGFICPSTNVFGTASIVWGVIGPGLQFSQGQLYYGLLYFFLIGALLPLLAYTISKRWPNPIFRYINFPVIFTGTGAIPPATAVNFVPWAIVGFIFNYVIRRRHFSWWTKYNYVLSAALDSSLAVSIVVIFFCLEYPKSDTIGYNTIQQWWGNTVFAKTADWNSVALRSIPTEGFGLTTW